MRQVGAVAKPSPAPIARLANRLVRPTKRNCRLQNQPQTRAPPPRPPRRVVGGAMLGGAAGHRESRRTAAVAIVVAIVEVIEVVIVVVIVEVIVVVSHWVVCIYNLITCRCLDLTSRLP